MRKHRLYSYTKTERFAVVRKLEKNRRYYCNFKVLYETQEAAETEALRLAREGHKPQYYVIEIRAVTNHTRLKKKVGAMVVEVK